jgi:DNA-binding YbaB/EbfC family protein
MNKNLIRQAQQLQARLEKAQQELETATVEASAGGGVVTVTVSGKLKIESVAIDPQAVDPDDVEMLEELVMAAANEALQKAQDLAQEKMGAITGGMNIPGLR